MAAHLLASHGYCCLLLLPDLLALCPMDEKDGLMAGVREVLIRFLKSLGAHALANFGADEGQQSGLVVVGCVPEKGPAAAADAVTPSLHPAVRDAFALHLGLQNRNSERPSALWTDINVAGQQHARNVLVETFEWPIKRPALYRQLRVTPPVGVLLYGPAGTGKSMLVRETAQRVFGSSFLSPRSRDIIRGEIGAGEAAVRRLFAEAKRIAPALVCLDEVQSLFTSRGGSSENGASLTACLAGCFDDLATWNSAAAGKLVFVVAITNEPWALDVGLFRGGRLEKLVFMGPLDAAGRAAMLGEACEAVGLTEGFTGADMKLLLRKAKLRAAVAGRSAVSGADAASVLRTGEVRASVTSLELKEYREWARRMQVASL